MLFIQSIIIVTISFFLVNVPLWLLIISIAISLGLFYMLFKKRCITFQEKSKVLEEKISALKKEQSKNTEELNNKQKRLEEQNDQILQQNKELEEHRSNLEELIKKRTKELKAAKEKAEENDKIKGAFLENMSHEIRTPMNAILGFINLLDSPSLDEKTRQYYVNYINQSGKVLLRLIDDIIDFARLEADQVFLDRRQCNVNELCESLIATYRKKASTEKPKVSVLLETTEKAINTTTDNNRLKQILNHLLANAFKYTEAGFIKLRYELVEKKILFQVEDSGVGIEEQYIDRIFDRFFKIENDNSKLFRGAGLGLSISKSLVTLLNGDISAKSKPGKGSTFSFYIPYHPYEVISSTDHKKKPINYVWDNKTFLIAEDENTNYHFIEAVLKKTGAKLMRAENGIELLELFDKNPEVDIILLDIKMPNMDGYKALKIIRESSSDVPILAQTAYNSPRDRKKSLQLGCNDFLSKPIPQHLLLEKVDKLLREADKKKQEIS